MVNDISSGTDREVPNLSAMPDLNFLELLTLMAARAADLVGARFKVHAMLLDFIINN